MVQVQLATRKQLRQFVTIGKAALAFYKKNGFVVEGTSESRYRANEKDWFVGKLLEAKN
jgi:ribosomal protein S18 acetylase RimI-like enzyme